MCGSIGREIDIAVGRIDAAKEVLEGRGTGRPQSNDEMKGKVKQYGDNATRLKNAVNDWNRYGCDDVLGKLPEHVADLLKEYDGGNKLKEYQKLYKSSGFDFKKILQLSGPFILVG